MKFIDNITPVNLIGLDFTETEVSLAIANEKALALVLQYGYRCQLACRFCYAAIGDEINRMVQLTGTSRSCLKKSDYNRILGEAAKCGIKSVYISGEGEPILHKDEFIDLIKMINKFELRPVVFTNGVLIDSSFANVLADLKVSIIGKCLSFDPEKNDYLVGKSGVYEYMEVDGQYVPSHIKYLIDAGVARDCRLAINCVVTRYNIDEIKDMWNWCRNNNIFPFMEFMVLSGFSSTHNQLDISEKMRYALQEKIHKLDTDMGIVYPLSYGPYLGNRKCDSRINLTIDLFGNARICACTYVPFGNVNKSSVADLIKIHYEKEKEYRRLHDNMTVYCECDRYNRSKM